MSNNSKPDKQFIRYLMVGFGSAAIEFSLFTLFDSILGFDIRIANPVAITCATAFNFYMNSSYTFKSSRNKKRSLFLYLLLFLINQIVTTITIVSLVSIGIPSTIAKILTMCCVVIWNYALFRKVIFK